ncbi:major facilitator superfamily domain-containing protein [Aspergillus pseudoustus]|uniref:Major facilitator superfamily domain-containing protein n=1 Tax=Aspergillus pseudoustus TaxID=1810923 RepID=A0ABR4JGE9_9EURO
MDVKQVPHASETPVTESVSDDAPVSVVNSSDGAPKKKAPIWRRFLGLFWDTWEDDGEENKFTRKLDYILFSYIMLGYFIKYLDQQNYSNAFVSGMQEDLQMYGNERNLLVTYFNIGIIIGTIPSQIVQLQWVRPSIWIPSCELAWSFLVMAMAGAKNPKTLYALRFFVGLLESCSFPGYAALLGSWYGPTQLAKRVALFEQSSAIASMFSGYLQAALYTGMNGKSGLKGWQWLFIFDAIISIPIAVWGYFAIPDHPSTTRAFWLKKKDREYSVQRQANMGRAPASKLTWKKLRKIYTGWYIWAFIFPYLMVAQAGQGSGFFNLWLKTQGYSTALVNTIPTAGNAISVVASLFFGTIADKTGTRAETCILVCGIVIVANIMLSIWNIPRAALLFAFFLSYVSAAAQPLIIAWGQEATQHNVHLRQMLVATGNIFTYTFMAWVPLVAFPTYDAPHYKYGYQLLIMFGGLAVLGVWLFGYLDKWDRKKRAEREEEENDATPAVQTTTV